MQMPLAPVVWDFGDESHAAGATGLTVDGAGLGISAGELWMYQNADRSGSADQLTVGTWSMTQLTGVAIPETLNNSPGTVYLFAKRVDQAWSPAYQFTLEVGATTWVVTPTGGVVCGGEVGLATLVVLPVDGGVTMAGAAPSVYEQVGMLDVSYVGGYWGWLQLGGAG